MMGLEKSVSLFIKEKIDCYQQWMYDEPIVIGKKYNDELNRLQKIMHKLITHFVSNYSKYKHLMPMSTEANDVLDSCKAPYRVGTYRTDFVFDKEGHAKIIEITCRFAFNGIFLSALVNKVAENRLKLDSIEIETSNLYHKIYKHLSENYFQGVSNIYILKGKDQRNESKIYQLIFENTGYSCTLLDYTEITEQLPYFKNELIISELSFDEILSLPKKTIQSLTKLNLINDFRTIFLIHDKRFFSVIGDDDFLTDILNPEEIIFFKRFYIPSFSFKQKNFDLNQVRKNKNGWIVKHRSLGKSQSVFAGITMTLEEWGTLLNQNLEDMTFQQWIPQQTIKGTIGIKSYDDYVTGTLLFFDEEYFGFGDFRTSSFPVTNKVDHRKSSSIILKNDADLQKLNYSNKFILT